MHPFLPNFASLFLSSFIALIILYYRLPVTALEQIILIIVVILLIFSHRLLLVSQESKPAKFVKAIFIFLTALLVQTLVLSSGGLKSPFFILIHLYTLGAGFLIGLSIALSFLFLTTLTIIFQLFFDENLRILLFEDFGTILLYLASLLVIIPLSFLLGRYYFLKDKLLEVVKKELKLKQIQHETLLKGIKDIIFVIDKNLIITSTNDAAQKELSLPESAIINHNLFNVLLIRDPNGKLANKQSLSIDEVFDEKATRIIKGMRLLVRNRIRPRFVDIQIRPITNLEGESGQVMIMVSDSSSKIKPEEGPHPYLEEAQTKYNAMMESFKKLLVQQNSSQLKLRADLILRMGGDISLLQELEDHTINLSPTLVDIAYVCLKSISKHQDFAKSLTVSLNFILPDFGKKDVAHLVPKGFQVSADYLTGPYFTAPIDIKYFELLINRILVLAILISSESKFGQAILGVLREGTSFIKVEVFIPNFHIRDEEKILLFSQYYGSLSSITNLRLGSGLEGYLAKTLANVLNVPIYFNDTQSGLIIGIKLSKGPG